MMKMLSRLVEGFVYTFGITPPQPGQQRVVSMVLGGAIACACLLVAALTVFMLVSAH